MGTIGRIQATVSRCLHSAIDQDGDDWQDLLAWKLFSVECADYARSLNHELAKVCRRNTKTSGVKIIVNTDQRPENVKDVKVDKWTSGQVDDVKDVGFSLQLKHAQLQRFMEVKRMPRRQISQPAPA